MKNIKDPDEITPIQEVDGYLFKMDDLFEFAPGHSGTKARTCLLQALREPGLTTSHTKKYPQGFMVAATAKELGIPCRVHTTHKVARDLFGKRPSNAVVIIHPDHEAMVEATQSDSRLSGFKFMAMNMDCTAANESVARQCENIPKDCPRIIVQTQTGATALDILHAMIDQGREDTKVLVICQDEQVVHDYFDTHGPDDWFHHAQLVSRTKETSTYEYGNIEGAIFWCGNIIRGK